MVASLGAWVMAVPGMRATAEKTSITRFRGPFGSSQPIFCEGPRLDRESEIKDCSFHRKHAASTGRAQRTVGPVWCAPQRVKLSLHPGGCVRFAGGVAVADDPWLA